MTSTVISPYLGGSAIELGNGIWRKRILPVGDVEYKGRRLHFTREYLDGLARAFARRAYDFCPLQLADSSNQHTNDPARTAGEVIGMTVLPDGLWIEAKVDERGQQILASHPQTGVSARIVEDYARSDGQYFPAAIQHALVTVDPRIPALGPWEPVEASNDGGVLIDLSSCHWTDPAYEFSASWLTDLNASAAEIAAFDQVMAELHEEYAAEGAPYGLTAQEWEQLVDQGAAELAAYEAGIELAAGRVSDGGYDSTSEANPTMDGVECPNPDCQILNNFAAKFCSQCGTPMPDASAPRNPGRNPAVTGSAAVAGLPASAMNTLANDLVGIGLASDMEVGLMLAGMSRTDPELYAGLAELDQQITGRHALEFSNEQIRRQQDAARPRSSGQRRSQHSAEDVLASAYARVQAGTYLPSDGFAFASTDDRSVRLSQLRDSQGRWAGYDDGQITDGVPCGHNDGFGRCGAAYHEASCSSLADPETALALRDSGVYALIAKTPFTEFSSATASDFIEANSGVKLSHDPDFSLFETGTSKRELISIGKRTIHGGDPDADNPGEFGYGASFETAAAVEAYKVAAGLERPHTSREARLAEIALRMPAPRHPDFSGVSTSRRAESRSGFMRQVEDSESLSGSLPVYSR